MLETQSKTIGDSTYTVRQLDAVKGTKVMVRLAKSLGPLFAAASGGSTSDALGKAFEALNEADVEYLCNTFAATTSVARPDATNPQLDKIFGLHFAGKYEELLSWFMFCLEVNFSGFFKGRKLQDRYSDGSGVDVKLPPGVDWNIWRLLVHPKLHVSLRDLEETWSLDDLMNAHGMLDALEEAEALTRKR